MPTREIFNANTQQLEDAELSVDQNHEIIATFEDGNFIKFPKGLTQKQFDRAISQHAADNQGKELFTPEQEAEQLESLNASRKLIGLEPLESLNAATPAEEDKTDASQENDKDSAAS